MRNLFLAMLTMNYPRLSAVAALVVSAYPITVFATNFNFTDTAGSTFTNGYVLSGTLTTNSFNTVTNANLSVSTNGGAPITFTSLPSQSGTYSGTICGTATTFQEYRFGNGTANTLYLDVLSSQLNAPLAGDVAGIHTSLLLSSGSVALNAACSAQSSNIRQIATASPYANMTQNAAAVVQANSSVFNAPALTNNSVPRLVNTITSNQTLFNNSIGAFLWSRFTPAGIAARKEAVAINKVNQQAAAIRASAEARAKAWAASLSELPAEQRAKFISDATAAMIKMDTQKAAEKAGLSNAKANAIARQAAANYRSGKGSGDDETLAGLNFTEDGNQDDILVENDDKRGLWIQPFASFARQNQLYNISPYTSNTAGFAAGYDQPLGAGWMAGGYVTYANSYTSSTISYAGNSMVTNMYQVGAYGQYSLTEDTNVQMTAGIGVNENSGSRITPDNSTASTRYNSFPINLGLSLNHSMELSPSTLFSPSLSANWMSINNNQINETGAGVWNLKTQSNSTNQLVFNLGGALDHDLDEAWSVNGRLGAGYAAINPSMMLVSAYAGAPNSAFTSTGNPLAPWMANGGVGVKYATEKGHSFFVNYDAQVREGFLNQTASAKFKYAF